MLSRADLKQRAKAGLNAYYWHAFIVSFILFALERWMNSGTAARGAGAVRGRSVTVPDISSWMERIMGRMSMEIVLVTLGTLVVTTTLLALVWTAVTIFITNLLKVGEASFYLESRRNRASAGVGHILCMFTGETYLPVFLTMFLRGLFITLWTLLLIVPGIIKRYEYRMVPYILAENPRMRTGEVLALSRQMMNGHKWECFILQLSFAGWFLLGALMCGMGVPFVIPYYNATMTEFYGGLKR